MRKREVVVVHSSDIHVDAPAGRDGSENLAAVLAVADRVGADLLLLAGDTFDSHRQPTDFLGRVAELIAAARLPVALLPGNHDPAVPGSVYRHLAAADNLHILGVTHEESVFFAELDLEVWGRAHKSYEDMDPFGDLELAGDAFTRARQLGSRWRIAMGHGHYQAVPDRTTRLRPSWLIGDAELAATGAHYVALGHWNQAVRVGDGRLPAYYSGSPDFAGSVNIVHLKSNGQVDVRREPIEAPALAACRA